MLSHIYWKTVIEADNWSALCLHFSEGIHRQSPIFSLVNPTCANPRGLHSLAKGLQSLAAYSWINYEVNANLEITFKNKRGNFFLPHQDLNNGPLEPKASVLPMSYTDPKLPYFVLSDSYLELARKAKAKLF